MCGCGVYNWLLKCQWNASAPFVFRDLSFGCPVYNVGLNVDPGSIRTYFKNVVGNDNFNLRKLILIV